MTDHLTFGPTDIDPYHLDSDDRRAYRTGLWLGVALPRHRRPRTDEECAAELAARIYLALDEERRWE